jgi:hypothetical protein
VRELEFLPADYLQARAQRRIGFIRSWLVVALGLAMVLWSIEMGAWVRHANAELESLRGTDTAVAADVERVRMLRAETRTYDRRIEMVQALRPRTTTTQILAAVGAALPEGVFLDEVSMDDEGRPPRDRLRVRLSGVAVSESGVSQTLSALGSAAGLDHPVLVESKVAQPGEAARLFVIEVFAGSTPVKG